MKSWNAEASKKKTVGTWMVLGLIVSLLTGMPAKAEEFAVYDNGKVVEALKEAEKSEAGELMNGTGKFEKMEPRDRVVELLDSRRDNFIKLLGSVQAGFVAAKKADASVKRDEHIDALAKSFKDTNSSLFFGTNGKNVRQALLKLLDKMKKLSDTDFEGDEFLKKLLSDEEELLQQIGLSLKKEKKEDEEARKKKEEEEAARKEAEKKAAEERAAADKRFAELQKQIEEMRRIAGNGGNAGNRAGEAPNREVGTLPQAVCDQLKAMDALMQQALNTLSEAENVQTPPPAPTQDAGLQALIDKIANRGKEDRDRNRGQNDAQQPNNAQPFPTEAPTATQGFFPPIQEATPAPEQASVLPEVQPEPVFAGDVKDTIPTDIGNDIVTASQALGTNNVNVMGKVDPLMLDMQNLQAKQAQIQQLAASNPAYANYLAQMLGMQMQTLMNSAWSVRSELAAQIGAGDATLVALRAKQTELKNYLDGLNKDARNAADPQQLAEEEKAAKRVADAKEKLSRAEKNAQLNANSQDPQVTGSLKQALALAQANVEAAQKNETETKAKLQKAISGPIAGKLKLAEKAISTMTQEIAKREADKTQLQSKFNQVDQMIKQQQMGAIPMVSTAGQGLTVGAAINATPTTGLGSNFSSNVPMSTGGEFRGPLVPGAR